MSLSFLARSGKPAIAYRKQEGANAALPTVVFLTGFRSDMDGTKAVYLEGHCAGQGQSFLRFDYSGHGKSEGAFEDGTIGKWRDDALEVIDRLTDGPLVLVGSSMGGWIGLLCALARPERVRGFVGLAAAPDFTRWMKAGMTAEQERMMGRDGYFPLPSGYEDGDYKITAALLEDGEENCLLDAPIDLSCPVRLVQGIKDDAVPWQTAEKIAALITGTDKKVLLREEGDHRLSTSEDLALIAALTDEVSGLIG
ncbi:MAG: alpha/beta hydrolase [Micavibrio aeruginosavorus]|uniref:Palmitoyl-protein thioesterase ABHD10, mitochondrial n=1 Tax=Micavibrio aeruginosavorus TaxID=349221 RepID=A0A2W4ZTI9_9BACT|nr:MAG: alpha/beta hydrolase [Micavibrio aeruginosavorus]